MDIIGSIFGIILTLPVMAVTALLIKLESPGPVIFKQMRVGRNGEHFAIYKFRSMYKDAEIRLQELMAQNEMGGDGKIFKMKNDPRITKIGKIIRKTSIDELPQFFNVLIGNMSLVGTRPPTVSEVGLYDRQHYRRISIKPGITGVWQTSGRNEISDFEQIVKMDIEYIDKWSLWLDIYLILKTVKVLIIKKGAY
jgi:exopolysaccharide biosynthesis polyprenyl glycosylphosphotransferase